LQFHQMRFGLDMPNMGACGSARALAELAYEAEQAGWDGFFVWDSVYAKMSDPRNDPTCDPWIALAAVAARTTRIRMGTMVTPVTRRRPWKLARETVTLDHLSGGRLILPVGLGTLDDGAFSRVGEIKDRKIRAQRLDEGLEILNGLWSGKPYRFSGEHYQVEKMAFLPKPYQSPRIPIWVVGAWPRMKSMRRAALWDGILPVKYNDQGQSMADEGNNTAGGMSPDDIRGMKTYLEKQRTESKKNLSYGTYDIVIGGVTPADDPALSADVILPYAEAGATWWLEAVWKTFYEYPGDIEVLRKRIRQGPPRLL
jgi:hypothetical protein